MSFPEGIKDFIQKMQDQFAKLTTTNKLILKQLEYQNKTVNAYEVFSFPLDNIRTSDKSTNIQTTGGSNTVNSGNRIDLRDFFDNSRLGGQTVAITKLDGTAEISFNGLKFITVNEGNSFNNQRVYTIQVKNLAQASKTLELYIEAALS